MKENILVAQNVEIMNDSYVSYIKYLRNLSEQTNRLDDYLELLEIKEEFVFSY